MAQPAPCSPQSQGIQYPKRQFRAAWIATVENIDWPSRSGLPTTTQQQEFIHLLDELVRMHMNAAIVQVRPSADAFYPTKYAPWSAYLTGVQGKDPGYDPLAFMVNEAHKRNIEFHAWFNPYRVSMQDQLGQLAASNPARQHPDWVVSYGGKLYYNPGIPAVRAFLVASILEVVKNYAIDAVHFDDYFYPYPIARQDFPDDATYRQYGAAAFPSKSDWRRDNVNLLIHELSVGIKATRPGVKFGVSPFGVWRNKAVDPSGSDTHAGVTDYDSLYADTRTWLKRNWLDYIAPQVYWNIGFPLAAYDKLVPWWSHEVAGTHVQLYIGQAAYKINNNTAAWANPDEMPAQLALDLRYSAVQGNIFFSMRSLLANPLGLQGRLLSGVYKYQALRPEMSWLGGQAPQPVSLQPLQRTQQGVVLHWNDPSSSSAQSYVIYRFPGHVMPNACDFADARSLLALVPRSAGDVQTFVDTTAQVGQTYTYAVTAVDRLNHESAPSQGKS